MKFNNYLAHRFSEEVSAFQSNQDSVKLCKNIIGKFNEMSSDIIKSVAQYGQLDNIKVDLASLKIDEIHFFEEQRDFRQIIFSMFTKPYVKHVFVYYKNKKPSGTIPYIIFRANLIPCHFCGEVYERSYFHDFPNGEPMKCKYCWQRDVERNEWLRDL
jgi:hypothetical protein